MNPQTLFDELEKEFCPPLDTSLLAALVFDLDDTTSSQIERLKSTLRELADQAAADELTPETDTEDSSEFTQGSSSLTNTTPDTSSSSADNSPLHASFETPLGFLQAALPHVPLATLQSALSKHTTKEGAAIDPLDTDDLWDVVASILTTETIREMEERGLDALDDDDAIDIDLEREEWNLVSKKKPTGKKKPKSKKDPTTFTLGDVRHRQLGHQIQALSNPKDPTVGTPAPDPWTQISSLSTYLSTLLPTHQPSFFASYFHKPDYATPYIALTTCLNAIVKAQKEEDRLDTESPEYADTLFNLLDILSHSPSPSPTSLSPSTSSHGNLTKLQQNTLISLTELALTASAGDASTALDLVHLLQELDEDGGGEGGVVGRMQRGVYHFSTGTSPPISPPTSPKPSQATAQARSPTLGQKLPTGPPSPPPPSSTSTSTSTTTPTSPSKKPPQKPTTKPSPYQWQKVPTRLRTPSSHPHEAYIPAYRRDVNGRLSAKGVQALARSRAYAAGGVDDYDAGVGFGSTGLGGGGGGGLGGYGGGYVGGEKEMRRKVAESMKRRRELLEQATRMWQRGKRGCRGGEVAWWFAERARQYQEMAKAESLNASRCVVEGRRLTHKDGPSTVDLHGVTAAEAVVIVREVLSEGSGIGGSAANPLKIITGKGSHSVNQVSVLKPAVKKALVEDGWNVSGWEGGLVVRGKR